MPQIEPLTESPPFPVFSPGEEEIDPVAGPEVVSLDARLDAVESSRLVGGVEDIDATPRPDKRLRVVLTADGLDIEDLIIEDVP